VPQLELIIRTHNVTYHRQVPRPRRLHGATIKVVTIKAEFSVPTQVAATTTISELQQHNVGSKPLLIHKKIICLS
jgi:hypothetical protein